MEASFWIVALIALALLALFASWQLIPRLIKLTRAVALFASSLANIRQSSKR